MSLRFSGDEWQDIVALKGNRTMSDTLRELVGLGIAAKSNERAP
jgi:hypothetical protein